MDVTTSAALIVGLKYAGPPGAELVKEFLSNLLMPSAEVGGRILAHPLQEWQRKRIERANRVVLDAALMVAETGKEPLPVPARILMPLLEKGSLEEDDILRTRWSALLANAATGAEQILPAFVEI